MKIKPYLCCMILFKCFIWNWNAIWILASWDWVQPEKTQYVFKLDVYFSKSCICSQLYQMIYILSYHVVWQTNGKIFGSRCICACQNQLNTSNEIIMELFKIISAKHCRGDLSYRATNTCQKYAKTNNLLVLWYLKML